VRLLALALLAGCAGTRGSLGTAGREIAEQLDAKSVQYFGEGCYAVEQRDRERWQHPRIVACSVDVLPYGQRICAREPSFDFGVGFYPRSSPLEDQQLDHHGGVRDPRVFMAALVRERHSRELDTFAEALNDHRCHERWNATLVCEPVHVEARAADRPKLASIPWPADLGTLRTDVTLDAFSRSDAYAVGERVEVDVELCVERDGTVAPSWGYFHGHGTSPLFREALRAITKGARTMSTSRGCTTARLSIGPIHCTNPSAIVQTFPEVRGPHR
jgi:hypothetical protein